MIIDVRISNVAVVALMSFVMPLMASSVALAEFSGAVDESSGWRCVSSEAGKVIYIPFEGYYESKGGRIESPRFKLGGEIGKNSFSEDGAFRE